MHDPASVFGKSIPLFKLFGFEVRVDLSWIVVAALVTWSLEAGFFPKAMPGLQPSTYWMMGVAGAVILFLSIVVHEFAHSAVARRYGIPMKGITLFIFGGVAEMHDEPPSAKAELLMAIAGPAASVALSLFFYAAMFAGRLAQWPAAAIAVVSYLASINLVLVVFNMIPAFPLDGGRVLRAILWMRKGNLRRATSIASTTGSVFGFLLILLGLVSVFAGNLVGGIWLFLIGSFVRNAAVMSYKQVVIREVLAGEPLTRVMNPRPVTVQRAISIADFVENYVYRYHHKMFPVMDGERLIGCVTTRQVAAVPREEWPRQTVGTLAVHCRAANSIAPDADVMAALKQMMKENYSRLMVVDGEKLVGIVSLKDVMQFLAVKSEIEGGRRMLPGAGDGIA